MTIHWPLFIAALILLGLTGFVNQGNRTNPVNRWFAAFTLSSTAWTIAIAAIYSGGPTLFWMRVSFATASFIPVTFLGFVEYYPWPSRNTHKAIRRILWSTSLCLSLLSATTPLVVVEGTLVQGTLTKTAGPLYPFFAIYFLTAWIIALHLLISKWRVTRGIERAQFRYLIVAVLVAPAGAIGTNLIHPFFTGSSTYTWLGPYFGFGFIGLIGHAVIRHRLMDLRLVIHRGLTLFVAIIVSLVPVALLLIIIAPRISLHLSPSEMATGLIAILVVALLIPITRDAAGRLLDRYVYRRQADYQRTVHEASRALTRVLHLKTLVSFMQETVIHAVECDGVALYLRRGALIRRGADEQQRDVNRGFEAPFEMPVSVIESLDATRDFLVTEALLRDGNGISADPLYADLTRLNWALVLPAVSENSVIGAIVLGPKLSGDPYYPQDLDLLMTLANQAGIAIKNAQLYAQVVLANEYLENIVATIPSGVVAVDADAIVTMFNPAAEQLTGLRHEQVRAHPLAALPPGLGDALAATLADGLARTQPELELSDGAVTRPVICTTCPLRDPDGAVLGAVAVFKDLTPVRELEMERRRAERLAYLETFASGIAHEVKNPLVAIKTFVQLIPRRRDDARFVEEFARVVGREIGRMERLVERLRTLSRPGQRPRRVLDVRQPLVDALEFMQVSFEEKNVGVEASLGDQETPVIGDGSELEQLFLNLLMNANEATPRGGRIGVVVSHVDGHVSVAVTDSGPGIPADALGRVFEPFFTTKERGSGLGLAICAGIADSHGARVRAENVNGGGARFTVEMPLVSEVPVPVTA